MTLRQKLMILLSGFALFVAGVTTATIWAVQLYIDTAFDRFNLWTTEAGRLDRLQSELDHHAAGLEELLADEERLRLYSTEQSALFTELEAPQQAREALPPLIADAIRHAAEELREQTRTFVGWAREGRTQQARDLLHEKIIPHALPELKRRLAASRPAMEAWRHEADQQLVRSGERVLLLAVGVVAGAAVLLLLGARWVGQWLILPIADLHRATEEYRRGQLDYRTVPRSADELGALATALNTMAEALGEADRVLQASERKSRALFENLRDALIICDRDGVVVESRDSTPPVFTTNAICGAACATIHELLAGASSAEFNLSQLVEEVAVKGLHRRGENVVLRTPGPNEAEDPRIVDYVAFPLELEGRTCTAVVLRDARERHRLQRRVREGEQMEAIGRFAGGIAHDFNNLLTGAIGSLSLIRDHPQDARRQDRLATALHSCWQAAGLSRRLLQFARGGRGHAQLLALSAVVETVLNSQEEAFFNGLDVRRILDPAVCVRMDKDELTQVVLNLFVNAREAMLDGGTLAVSVEGCAASSLSDGRTRSALAVLRVTDTGAGMPPDVRRRIFEPFFTTKNRSEKRGSGLGLSIALAAVRSAGGDITVESEPGAGTTFAVFLPRSPCAAAPEPEPSTPAQHAGIASTVLVVDDDPLVLSTCAETLERWGCRVLKAGSVAEAEAAMSAPDGEAIEAALIDVDLPDGSGYDLAEAWLTQRPALRVAVMSGFAAEPLPERLASRLSARLDKPFSADALRGLLRREG